jgi:integrase
MPRPRINLKTGKKEWFARVSVNGVSREKKAGSKREAIEAEVQLRKELKKELEQASALTKINTLEDLQREYMLDLKARGMCQNSLNAKRIAFRRLFKSVKSNTKVGELSKLAITKFMQKVAKMVSANSANVDIRHIKAAYNWAINADMISCDNPCAKIAPYRSDKNERYMPSMEDFQKAINACETTQDRIMLLVYFETSARLREVLNLKWSDINLEVAQVQLWTGKRRGGREGDWVGVSAHLVDLLRDQKRETGFKEYVFISPKTGTKFYNRPKFFAGLAKRAGIKRFTAHGIRHLSASQMYHGGANVAYIQRRLRHTSPTTTDRYLHGFKGVAQSSIIASASAQLLGVINSASRDADQVQAN